MASFTNFLKLLKKNPATDGKDTFNIEIMLNENWDKIDQKVEENSSAIGQIANEMTREKTLYATISTTWVGVQAPYTQIIEVIGMLLTDNPIIDIDLKNIITYAEQQHILSDWGNIYRITTDTNNITVYSSAKTTINIPIQIKVVA